MKNNKKYWRTLRLLLLLSMACFLLVLGFDWSFWASLPHEILHPGLMENWMQHEINHDLWNWTLKMFDSWVWPFPHISWTARVAHRTAISSVTTKISWNWDLPAYLAVSALAWLPGTQKSTCNVSIGNPSGPKKLSEDIRIIGTGGKTATIPWKFLMSWVLMTINIVVAVNQVNKLLWCPQPWLPGIFFKYWKEWNMINFLQFVCSNQFKRFKTYQTENKSKAQIVQQCTFSCVYSVFFDSAHAIILCSDPAEQVFEWLFVSPHPSFHHNSTGNVSEDCYRWGRHFFRCDEPKFLVAEEILKGLMKELKEKQVQYVDDILIMPYCCYYVFFEKQFNISTKDEDSMKWMIFDPTQKQSKIINDGWLNWVTECVQKMVSRVNEVLVGATNVLEGLEGRFQLFKFIPLNLKFVGECNHGQH